MTEHDLTGWWQGHYEQDGEVRPIAMLVIQRDDRFTGEMSDAITRVVVETRARDPYAGAVVVAGGESCVEQELPSRASIDGTVTGDRVHFVKHYRGHVVTTNRIADLAEWHVEQPGHRVDYEGTIDAATTTLTGQWTIAAPDPATPPQRGRFRLQRHTVTLAPK